VNLIDIPQEQRFITIKDLFFYDFLNGGPLGRVPSPSAMSASLRNERLGFFSDHDSEVLDTTVQTT